MSDCVRIKVHISKHTDPALAALCEDKNFRIAVAMREALRAHVKGEKKRIYVPYSESGIVNSHNITIILYKGTDDNVISFLNAIPAGEKSITIRNVFLSCVDHGGTRPKKKNASRRIKNSNRQGIHNEVLKENNRDKITKPDTSATRAEDDPGSVAHAEDLNEAAEENEDVWGMFDKI